MAKIRAYKIAEELGLDRNELVEKAATLGIELKSAMATLEDGEAGLLREKLGVGGKGERGGRRRGGGGAAPRAREPPRVLGPVPLGAQPEPLAAAGLELVPEPAVVTP